MSSTTSADSSTQADPAAPRHGRAFWTTWKSCRATSCTRVHAAKNREWTQEKLGKVLNRSVPLSFPTALSIFLLVSGCDWRIIGGDRAYPEDSVLLCKDVYVTDLSQLGSSAPNSDSGHHSPKGQPVSISVFNELYYQGGLSSAWAFEPTQVPNVDFGLKVNKALCYLGVTIFELELRNRTDSDAVIEVHDLWLSSALSEVQSEEAAADDAFPLMQIGSDFDANQYLIQTNRNVRGKYKGLLKPGYGRHFAIQYRSRETSIAERVGLNDLVLERQSTGNVLLVFDVREPAETYLHIALRSEDGQLRTGAIFHWIAFGRREFLRDPKHFGQGGGWAPRE